MDRIPEPELMDEPEQAQAYASADFEQPHGRFMELLLEHFPDGAFGRRVLDLGCGPADIAVRFARAFPAARVDGVDGAEAMLIHGRHALQAAGLDERVRLILGRLPDVVLDDAPYDGIISNSLLHHLHDPNVLWRCLRRWARPGAAIFVMDLMRPATTEQAADLVAQYAAREPGVLRRDFHHSLLAAFRPDEVRRQLTAAGLDDLRVEVVGDRHLTITGYMP